MPKTESTVKKKRRGRPRKIILPIVDKIDEPIEQVAAVETMPAGRFTPETHPNLFDDFGNPL